MGKEGFRYVSAVVANCKMLALELETQEVMGETDEQETAGLEETPDAPETSEMSETSVDMEALVLAAYLHDISTVEHGFQEHHRKSAEMAVAYLRELDVAEGRINRVEQAILTHTSALTPEQRNSAPIEGRILYDADKIGRLSGLAVVTALIEFGARYPNRAVTGDVLAAILRHIEERFVELYQSLNTAPARAMASEKFGGTLAFLDGVIEHLSDATPV